MKIKLAPSTRLAIQAAIAVTSCILIGEYFQLQRSYWAVLTAILMISQTWGESIKKGFERIAMTILGGIVGTVLYFIIGQQDLLIFAFILISVFFMVYFRGISYLITAFFITMFVVFLFAMLGRWDIHVLELRIYETVIGAVVAIITSAIVLPMTAKGDLPKAFHGFVTKVTKITKLSFSISIGKTHKKYIEQQRKVLIQSYSKLVKKVEATEYETFFRFYPSKKIHGILLNFSILMHYSTSLLEVSAQIQHAALLPNLKTELENLEKNLHDNLNYLQLRFTETTTSKKLIQIEEKIPELISMVVTAIETQQQVFHNETLNIISFLYFAGKLNEALLRLDDLLS